MNTLIDTLQLDSDNAAPGLLGLAERGLMPDALLRAGIRRMCVQRRDAAKMDRSHPPVTLQP